MKTCHRCGEENADRARFCQACGAALTADQPSREERKVVSVLFCDLVGSTARAEGADPEDVRALLSAYHGRVRSELERFGGTVEKFIGDAVMALFGAPVTREDDPERALRAALAIREWAQAEGELQVRIGITTGEALVALDARPGSGEGMAAGDVVNTAARLQAAAPVDGILVDESTERATAHVIEYAEHAAIEAKGKAEPVAVWLAVEARARLGVDTRPEARAALVGRSHELEVLAASLARVRREREPQLVTLVGVPGIGKSRLVWELSRQVADDPELIAWRQGRSPPYGDGVTYWALGEMVKAHAGILETDTPEDSGRKLNRAVSDLIAEDREAGWVERHLRPLVGLAAPVGPSDHAEGEAFPAWRRFFEALAEWRPLVLVFEDLHFADDGLLDFVDHLVDWAGGVPILVVCTARPELLARRSGWGGGKPNATTLSLSPLSDAETAELVHALLERGVLPAETQAALLERAGGNPLYAEEFASMVTSQDGRLGEAALPVPESVQGLIAARLDALSPDEKALLQDAAVVGKVFWLGVAAAIGGVERNEVEERLHALQRREFVRRERSSSVADEAEYAFRHLLVRDVAYGQIPRAARAEKHRLAAEWLSELGRPEDQAELIAHHYLAALEFARAARQGTEALADRARFALRDAAERASALDANAAAARFYADALALWPDDGERPYLLLRAGGALAWSAEEGFDELEEARRSLLEAGDVEAAAEAESMLGTLWWRRGRNDITSEHDRRAARMLEGRPPSPAKAWVLSRIAGRLMAADQVEEAVSTASQSVSMAEELGLDGVLIESLINLGSTLVAAGDRRGAQHLERAIDVAQRANRSPVRAYGNYAGAIREFGELERSRQLLELAVRAQEQRGSVSARRWLRGELAIDLFWLGEWDEVVRIADERLAEAEAGQPSWLDPEHRRLRGAVRLARGDVRAALDDVRKGLEFCRVADDPQVLFPALAANAHMLLAAGRPDESNEHMDELVERWTERPQALMRSHWVVNLTVTSFGLGREAEVRALLARSPVTTPWIEAARHLAAERALEAASIFAGMGTRPEEATARLFAARALIADGRAAAGAEQLELAVAFWRSVGATRLIGEAEELRARSA